MPTGLNIEGLYRVAGQTEEIMKIKEEFDKGTYVCVPNVVVALTIVSDISKLFSILGLEYIRTYIDN